MGRALVKQVDGLVGQEAVGQVAGREVDGGLDGLLRDADAVVGLEAGAQSLQHPAGGLAVRLADRHGTEAPLERGVLLDKFAVFLQRRRADHLQLSPAERGLEQVRRVDRALGAARADDGVHLVDKEDDVAAAADLLQDVAHALFKFAAVFCPGEQVRHVEAVELFAAQRLRHVAAGQPLGQRLDDGGLADTGLADERGVVFAAAAEHLHELRELRLTADDRIRLGGAVEHVFTVEFQKLQFRLSSRRPRGILDAQAVIRF